MVQYLHLLDPEIFIDIKKIFQTTNQTVFGEISWFDLRTSPRSKRKLGSVEIPDESHPYATHGVGI